MQSILRFNKLSSDDWSLYTDLLSRNDVDLFVKIGLWTEKSQNYYR